jgi:hypothetical protein
MLETELLEMIFRKNLSNNFRRSMQELSRYQLVCQNFQNIVKSESMITHIQQKCNLSNFQGPFPQLWQKYSKFNVIFADACLHGFTALSGKKSCILRNYMTAKEMVCRVAALYYKAPHHIQIILLKDNKEYAILKHDTTLNLYDIPDWPKCSHSVKSIATIF